MRNIKWVVIALLGAVVWLEVFLLSPVASILLLMGPPTGGTTCGGGPS